MKKVYANSDPAFTEIEFWSNGQLEVSRTRHWSNGSFFCTDDVLSAMVETLNSEGEALVSNFDFQIDFLSNPSDPQISARCLNENLPVEIPDQIALAFAEDRIEGMGYSQVDYLLWLTCHIPGDCKRAS